jgi:hypothetical protein
MNATGAQPIMINRFISHPPCFLKTGQVYWIGPFDVDKAKKEPGYKPDSFCNLIM